MKITSELQFEGRDIGRGCRSSCVKGNHIKYLKDMRMS